MNSVVALGSGIVSPCWRMPSPTLFAQYAKRMGTRAPATGRGWEAQRLVVQAVCCALLENREKCGTPIGGQESTLVYSDSPDVRHPTKYAKRMGHPARVELVPLPRVSRRSGEVGGSVFPPGLKPWLTLARYAALEGPLFHGEADNREFFRTLWNSCPSPNRLRIEVVPQRSR